MRDNSADESQLTVKVLCLTPKLLYNFYCMFSFQFNEFTITKNKTWVKANWHTFQIFKTKGKTNRSSKKYLHYEKKFILSGMV